MENQFSIIDFVERENALYIQIKIFDGGQDAVFIEEVRFLDDLLYGEMVHPKRSPLSENCRLELMDYLKKHFER